LARRGIPRAHGPSSGRIGRRLSMRAVYGIVAREFVRFLRQRGRVLASIGRPFVWLVFAGAGFAAVFAGRNEIDYRVYMAPGLLGMVVMFGSLLAALSTVTDREAGVLRMVLVAPIRRRTIAFGKALGAATYVNPLAYGVDLLKHALLGGWARAGYGGELPVPLDCAALALFAIVGLAVAAPLLGREGGVTRTAFRERR